MLRLLLMLPLAEFLIFFLPNSFRLSNKFNKYISPISSSDNFSVSQIIDLNNDKNPELNKIIDNNYYYLPNQMDLTKFNNKNN